MDDIHRGASPRFVHGVSALDATVDYLVVFQQGAL